MPKGIGPCGRWGGLRTGVVDEGDEVRGGVARKEYRLGGDVVAVREGDAVDAAVGDHLGSVTVLAQGGVSRGQRDICRMGRFAWRVSSSPPTAVTPGSGGRRPSGCMTTGRAFMIPRWAASCSRIPSCPSRGTRRR
jgi:hypothetical protein